MLLHHSYLTIISEKKASNHLLIFLNVLKKMQNFLRFIVDMYEELAPYTFFLHADAPEHIPHFTMILELAYTIATGMVDDLGFVHMSHNYVDHSVCGVSDPHCEERENLDFQRVWKAVFQSSIAPRMQDVAAYCCTQFMVSARRIRKRPR